jgi:hypothetical protein
MEQLQAASKDPHLPSEMFLNMGEMLITAHLALNKDRREGLNKIIEALDKSAPGHFIPLVIKGDAYVSYAWDARGCGWANSVTEAGWGLMRERLKAASEALEKAWALNPQDSLAAQNMIGVELGQGQGRERMEMWFKRAMEANPYDHEACHKKIYYLEPKWYGSDEEMLAFGRACLKTRRWETRIPFILVDTHMSLAENREENKQDYYLTPNVWEDIKSVYEPYLKFYPDNYPDMSMYAKLACYCRQWEAANRLFTALGDNVVVTSFANRKEMEQLKAQAARPGAKNENQDF